MYILDCKTVKICLQTLIRLQNYNYFTKLTTFCNKIIQIHYFLQSLLLLFHVGLTILRYFL